VGLLDGRGLFNHGSLIAHNRPVSTQGSSALWSGQRRLGGILKGLCLGVAVGASLMTPVVRAAGATITISQELDAARPGAIVSVPFRQIDAAAPGLRMFHVVVRDPRGRVLPSQITNYQHDHRGASYDDLVFPYDFAAGQKKVVFTLESVGTATAPEKPCAYARFVPERLDDMAWENDRIAHRMYGATLNSEVAAAVGERLRGSGIDVWAKKVSYPIVDRWYAKGHDQFHKDGEGEGFDLYSIGGARGAGGTGVWDGKKLWTSDNFATAQVLSNGPRRASFKLNYAPFDTGTGLVSETKQFTVDCGVNFDAVESVFDFPGPEGTVAIGLTQHKPGDGFAPAAITRDAHGRWISIWEQSKDGGVGVAAILATGTESSGIVADGPDERGVTNHLLLVKAADGAPVRYFTGAGWDKSGQFKDRAEWETYVRNFAAGVAAPLTVTVSARP
jgi:hypothetical protein